MNGEGFRSRSGCQSFRRQDEGGSCRTGSMMSTLAVDFYMLGKVTVVKKSCRRSGPRGRRRRARPRGFNCIFFFQQCIWKACGPNTKNEKRPLRTMVRHAVSRLVCKLAHWNACGNHAFSKKTEQRSRTHLVLVEDKEGVSELFQVFILQLTLIHVFPCRKIATKGGNMFHVNDYVSLRKCEALRF